MTTSKNNSTPVGALAMVIVAIVFGVAGFECVGGYRESLAIIECDEATPAE